MPGTADKKSWATEPRWPRPDIGIDAASRQLGHSGEYVTKLYIDPTIAQSKIDGVVHLPRPKLDRGEDD